jgi:hypothetical protein
MSCLVSSLRFCSSVKPCSRPQAWLACCAGLLLPSCNCIHNCAGLLCSCLTYLMHLVLLLLLPLLLPLLLLLLLLQASAAVPSSRSRARCMMTRATPARSPARVAASAPGTSHPGRPARRRSRAIFSCRGSKECTRQRFPMQITFEEAVARSKPICYCGSRYVVE